MKVTKNQIVGLVILAFKKLVHKFYLTMLKIDKNK